MFSFYSYVFLHNYEGRLQSSWTHLVILSRNLVEVRWRSLFRSTSLGKRYTSYNSPPTSRIRAAGRWTIGVLGFDSRRGLGIFPSTAVSRMALGTTQPPIQWLPAALSLWVKRPGREADHSPPSSAEVKNAWSYTSSPPIRLHGVVLR
jgi:hypothetical protein